MSRQRRASKAIGSIFRIGRQLRPRMPEKANQSYPGCVVRCASKWYTCQLVHLSMGVYPSSVFRWEQISMKTSVGRLELYRRHRTASVHCSGTVKIFEIFGTFGFWSGVSRVFLSQFCWSHWKAIPVLFLVGKIYPSLIRTHIHIGLEWYFINLINVKPELRTKLTTNYASLGRYFDADNCTRVGCKLKT